MEKPHFNSAHDDATWRALFGRWHAGETAKALRAEAGVSHDTWTANARRLGMRIRDLAADDPRRRRVPAFAERTGDYQHPKSVLNERDWLRVLALRARGVRGKLLAEVFGVGAATICSQAKARGMEPPHRTARPPLGLALDWSDPQETYASILNAMLRAMDDERYGDYDELERLLKQVERTFQGMEGGAVTPCGSSRPSL